MLTFVTWAPWPLYLSSSKPLCNTIPQVLIKQFSGLTKPPNVWNTLDWKSCSFSIVAHVFLRSESDDFVSSVWVVLLVLWRRASARTESDDFSDTTGWRASCQPKTRLAGSACGVMIRTSSVQAKPWSQTSDGISHRTPHVSAGRKGGFECAWPGHLRSLTLCAITQWSPTGQRLETDLSFSAVSYCTTHCAHSYFQALLLSVVGNFWKFEAERSRQWSSADSNLDKGERLESDENVGHSLDLELKNPGFPRLDKRAVSSTHLWAGKCSFVVLFLLQLNLVAFLVTISKMIYQNGAMGRLVSYIGGNGLTMPGMSRIYICFQIGLAFPKVTLRLKTTLLSNNANGIVVWLSSFREKGKVRTFFKFCYIVD